MNDESVFELHNASYSYPDAPALKNVNLNIKHGEQVAVLGANGCGKTTLLRILAGLALPQSGDFSAFGSRMTKKSLDDDRTACAYHKRVGFVFQDSDAQLFCTSLREEIAFGPLQTGMTPKEAARRVDDLAQMLGLAPLLDKAPFHLSGGEKKKAALAAVLALSPEVLVLDEPTNGLDPRTTRSLIDLLKSLGRAGKTLIVSTHHLGLVRELAERVILFDEAHTVAADGPTECLLADKALLCRVNLVDERFGGEY